MVFFVCGHAHMRGLVSAIRVRSHRRHRASQRIAEDFLLRFCSEPAGMKMVCWVQKAVRALSVCNIMWLKPHSHMLTHAAWLWFESRFSKMCGRFL